MAGRPRSSTCPRWARCGSSASRSPAAPRRPGCRASRTWRAWAACRYAQPLLRLAACMPGAEGAHAITCQGRESAALLAPFRARRPSLLLPHSALPRPLPPCLPAAHPALANLFTLCVMPGAGLVLGGRASHRRARSRAGRAQRADAAAGAGGGVPVGCRPPAPVRADSYARAGPVSVAGACCAALLGSSPNSHLQTLVGVG